VIRRLALFPLPLLTALWLALPAPAAAAEECNLVPRAECFGIESVTGSLSTAQAGAHPDVTFNVEIKKDPESTPNVAGLKNSYSPTRNLRINLPPGLIGDPNVLGAPQQCTEVELITALQKGGCPNGSQVGITTISTYHLGTFREPLYMMRPPGGDVVARVGLIAGTLPVFIDLRVRSEGDYGIVADVRDAPAAEQVVRLGSTIWGVPTAESHDNERCTPLEAFNGCAVSPKRPPGGRRLPFMTNPTRCGVPLQIGVNAASWFEPEFDPAKEVTAPFATITGCNNLPFGPSLTALPTSRRPASPTGLDITIRLPASDGVNVLEPSQMRDIRIAFPPGLVSNAALGDGLGVCSAAQVHFGERVNAECPNSAKIADTEFDIPVLARRMKGAIYLREPEPGNPFRVWVVADDLGAHVKLPGQLEFVDQNGQIQSIVLDAPQAPLREVKIDLKSGFRAPLINPPACGTYFTHYEFIPWSGGPPATGNTPMTLDEGCAGLGGFSPGLSAGSTDATAGRHAPFVFTLTRADGEQNPASFNLSLPPGLAATFAGVSRCEGAAAETGACPGNSRVGRVAAAIGAGPAPLWVPQPDRRPSAVYLAGPYRGAPLSFVAVVPRQAGPFDFGDEVIRSPVYVDPVTAQATTRVEALPQIIEGIPLTYRTIHVALDRPGFTLNPTNCAPMAVRASVTSSIGAVATPSARFAAANCAVLPFHPNLQLTFKGKVRRTAHPTLIADLTARPGEANIARAQVRLPKAAFLDQGNIGTVCTRVQFAADACPPASVYGRAYAVTPLLEERLSGLVYLRSSSHPLPDLVVKLRGPDSLPIEIDLLGRTDAVKGALRNTFEAVPDAPVSHFHLELPGGHKGLIELSHGFCANPRAAVNLTGQNRKLHDTRPVVASSCPKRSRHHMSPRAQR